MLNQSGRSTSRAETKRSVARRYSLTAASVAYSDDQGMLSSLDGVSAIYDKSTELSWLIPPTTGEKLVSFVPPVLTTNKQVIDLTSFNVERSNFHSKPSYDFTKGFTLRNGLESVVYGGVEYRWAGTFPKVVAAGSVVGAVTADGWVTLWDYNLRKNLKSSDATSPGSDLVVHSSGLSLKSYLDNFFLVTPEEFTGTDTQQLLAACAKAKATGRRVAPISQKTYKITGTTPIEVDLCLFSFGPLFGACKFDFSGFTGTNGALWVHASGNYPKPMYQNTTNICRGIEMFGDITKTTVAGLKLGSDTKTANDDGYNGQSCLQNISVYNFGINILCSNNCWRINVSEIMVSSAGSKMFYAPASLTNSGESISFSRSQFSDSKGSPIEVECPSFTLTFSKSSILNTKVVISGAGALVNMTEGSNLENPNQQVWYRYVSVTGRGARFSMTDSTLVINQGAIQTKPIMYVAENAYISLKTVKIPGNNYAFNTQADDLLLTFIEGDGIVMALGITTDLNSGAGCIPLHKSLNPLADFNFSSGVLGEWVLNTSGSASQTATFSADYGLSGTGVRLKSIAGLSVFLTQTFDVKSMGSFVLSVPRRIAVKGAGDTAGNINIDFYTKKGTKITGFGTALTGEAVTDGSFTMAAKFVRGIVPAGAHTATIAISATNGASVDYDSALINIYGVAA